MAELITPTQPLIVREGPPLSRRVFTEGGAWLFNIGLVVFLAALMATGGLFFYARRLSAARQAWAEEVGRNEAELRPELLAQLIDLSRAIAAGRELLGGHPAVANVFRLMEEATHQRVQFTSFAFAVDAAKVDVAGSAASYQTVAEQVRLLEAHPHVARVEFGGLSLGERGLVNFKLAVTLKPSLLKIRGE